MAAIHVGTREELHAFADRIADALEKACADGWVNQNASPLGKAKHLALAKSGKVPAFKDGKQVFIRRSAIDAYIESQPMMFTVDPAADAPPNEDHSEQAALVHVVAVGPTRVRSDHNAIAPSGSAR